MRKISLKHVRWHFGVLQPPGTSRDDAFCTALTKTMNEMAVDGFAIRCCIPLENGYLITFAKEETT